MGHSCRAPKLEAFCRDHPEKIPYDELGEHMQLWLRDLGYPAVDGFSRRELADKLNVSRRQVAYWLRHCWLREVNGKIPADSIRRFCRAHAAQIPYDKLDAESQEWLRDMGYSPADEVVEQRQLLSEEQIFRRHCDTGSSEEEHKPTEVNQHFVNGPEAVNRVSRMPARGGHKRSGSHTASLW